MAAHTNVTCCKSEIAVWRFEKNLNNCSSQQSMTSKRLLIKCPNLMFHCVVLLFFFLLILIIAEWIIHHELVYNNLQPCPLPSSTMQEAAPTIKLTFSCSSFHNAGSMSWKSELVMIPLQSFSSSPAPSTMQVSWVENQSNLLQGHHARSLLQSVKLLLQCQKLSCCCSLHGWRLDHWVALEGLMVAVDGRSAAAQSVVSDLFAAPCCGAD